MADIEQQLAQQVSEAVERHTPLNIVGGGSKSFFGCPVCSDIERLELADHSGIVNYEPTELVVTARAGTTIRDLKTRLAEQRQMMPFEPPELDGKATLGGTLACGFSGPARIYAGAARDYVLGAKIINGRAEVLRLGGEVMKNVAGYDVSRLMVGAMGTLGVILQVSMKVLPRPASELTLLFQLGRDEALTMMNDLAGRPFPLTASCFFGDLMYLRLGGAGAAVKSARSELGGEEMPPDDEIWRSLREFDHPFFNTPLPVWRIALPAMARPELQGECLIDWGGAQWWLRSEMPADELRLAVARVGGHATLFRGDHEQVDVFHPMSPAMLALQHRVQDAMDPMGLFNPGKMFARANVS